MPSPRPQSLRLELVKDRVAARPKAVSGRAGTRWAPRTADKDHGALLKSLKSG